MIDGLRQTTTYYSLHDFIQSWDSNLGGDVKAAKRHVNMGKGIGSEVNGRSKIPSEFIFFLIIIIFRFLSSILLVCHYLPCNFIVYPLSPFNS